MNTIEKAVLAGGIASAAGFLGYVLYEKSTEQPPYRTLESNGSLELREYPPLLVAEAVHDGKRRDALSAGFNDLAGYIFAKNRGGEKISMTAPVIQDRENIAMSAPVVQRSAGAGRWRTRFVMPAKYRKDTLPPPPAGVTIDQLPARRIAAVRFSGSGGDETLREKEAELRQWLDRLGLTASGPVEYAFYNSPFVPPPLRRNEVLIPVAER